LILLGCDCQCCPAVTMGSAAMSTIWSLSGDKRTSRGHHIFLDAEVIGSWLLKAGGHGREAWRAASGSAQHFVPAHPRALMFSLRKPVTLSKRSDGWARHLGGKFLATSNAVRSLASSAIFCAGMTSPAMRSSFGTKHQPVSWRPDESSSKTLMPTP
jgi:hypothetical protein